ncbi:MAG: CARDB domain-containing protein, partial [Pseudooceanicola atlanticus]
DPRRPSTLKKVTDPGDVDFGKGNSAILLATIPRNGVLGQDDSYTRKVKVRIPDTLPTGRYFITPWTDSTDLVVEDTLAGNENPDDPNEFDSNNYKGRAIDVIGFTPRLPNLVAQEVTSSPAVISGREALTVSWAVENLGTGAIDGDALWRDVVYLSDNPVYGAPGATTWRIGAFDRTGPLDVNARYTRSETIDLPPGVSGQYVHVVVDQGTRGIPGIGESDETDNVANGTADVTAAPGDLRVVDITPPPDGTLSGAEVEVSWIGEYLGPDMWDGTVSWRDAVWISPDPVLDLSRATRLAVTTIVPDAPLKDGDQYTGRATVTLPAGIDGPYFIHVIADAAASGRQAEREATSGSADAAADLYAGSVFEGSANDNNIATAEFQAVFSEPNLEFTQITLPDDLKAGQEVPISFTVTNTGTRVAQAERWYDRVFISRDGGLDGSDHLLATFERFNAVLGPGESYTVEDVITLPVGIEGPFHILFETDSRTADGGIYTRSDVAEGLNGLRASSGNPVNEFQFEGDNLQGIERDIEASPGPDLRVTQLEVPDILIRGERLEITYRVTNAGSATIPSQGTWTDLIYLSRDEVLDPSADIFLGSHTHEGGLTAGDHYDITRDLTPRFALSGEYYVFVVTDRATARAPIGAVYEGGLERNNSLTSATPIRFREPPPADLVTSDVGVTGDMIVGEEIAITYRVTNNGTSPASGRWTDAIYMSTDAGFDLGDRLVGRVEQNRTLAPGESYTGTLTTTMPVAAERAYRFIVRSDVRNEVNEDGATANNLAATETSIYVTTPDIPLGSATPVDLAAGEERLYRVTTGLGQTLRTRIAANDPDAQLEIFVKYDGLPTGTDYDAIYDTPLSAVQQATIGSTLPGEYYILVRNIGDTDQDVALLPEILPFQITDVRQDRVGDGRYVTTVVEGASFAPGAVLRLTRPGVASVLPINQEILDGSRIVAVFDLAGAERGLYDVEVINPDGETAVKPYRVLVERAIENQVGLALGGPRIVPVGQTGNYALTLQNFSNIDTPYVHFTFGAPNMGQAEGVYDLPFLKFTTNLSGDPATDAGSDVPWADLGPITNTTGHMLAPGFAYDLPTGGLAAFSFNIQTYPVLQALVDRDFEQVREYLYDAYPELREDGALDAGPDALADVNPVFDLIFRDPRIEVLDDAVRLYAPFQFHVLAAATPLTRDEFVALQLAEADRLRDAILADPEAQGALAAIAGDATAWRSGYLAALETAGILRPDGEAPPARERGEVVSLLSTLSMGVLLNEEADAFRTSTDLVAFFAKVREWYGNDDTLLADIARYDIRSGENVPPLDIPVPALPDADDFALGLTYPTLFQAFNVFSPLAGEDVVDNIGSDLSTSDLSPLDLGRFLEELEAANRNAAMLGPQGYGEDQIVPANTRLPFEIRFGDAQGGQPVQELRITTELDPNFDPRSFRLGSLRLGDVVIEAPENRALFQTDLDLTGTLGYVLRLSAGIDVASRTATWLVQAIAPDTGEVATAGPGLLTGDNPTGAVTYAVTPGARIADGARLISIAKVDYDTRPSDLTNEVSQTVDTVAPATALTVQRVTGTDRYELAWTASDARSGVRHVSLYVATDGGDFRLLEAQSDANIHTFVGEAGHSYEFLALATDNAGNTERPPAGITAPDDGFAVNLGGTEFGPATSPTPLAAPAPTDAVANDLFLEVLEGVTAPNAPSAPAFYTQVASPFSAAAFARGFPDLDLAGIGPTALAEAPDGSIVVIGGPQRSALYHLPARGGNVAGQGDFGQTAAPIYDMAFGADGRL